MPTSFQYQVCYGVADRVTFSNGVWLGADIPESQRTQQDLETCPLVWEFLEREGRAGWELVSVIEPPGSRPHHPSVRTYFLKRDCSTSVPN